MLETMLAARGVKDVDEWLAADTIHSWRLLDDMELACEMVNGIVKEEKRICLPVDCDCDGFASAAILYNFLTGELGVDPELIKYLVHDGKMHGLHDLMDLIPEDTDLVLIADAGTSDYAEQDELAARGCKVCVLDHHQAEYKNSNPDVVTVNNQLDDYPDKSLTGAGIAWQFTRAYMDIYCGLDDYMDGVDLCAFGNISDMASYLDPEIRTIVCNGMAQVGEGVDDHNCYSNGFLAALMKDNEYTLNKYGGRCYKGCSFALTPFVNAICRSGTIEEKRGVFSAMLNVNAHTLVQSKRKGARPGDTVSFPAEASRVALNVKARQAKEQAKMVDRIVAKNELDSDVNVVVCEERYARPELAGVVANKLQDMSRRPTIVLLDYPEEGVYRGSARNCDKSPIEDFRVFCQDSGLVNYAAGHPSAFGVEIPHGNLEKFADYCESARLDYTQDATVTVDLRMTYPKISKIVFNVGDQMSGYVGQQIPPVKVLVEDIPIGSCDVTLLSPDKSPTLKVVLPNGTQLLKFKSSKEEVDKLQSADTSVMMTVVGTPSLNRWNGKVYNQILVDDYFLEEKWIF